jgi:ubiquinone biosynthesis O-methyltransferase
MASLKSIALAFAVVVFAMKFPWHRITPPKALPNRLAKIPSSDVVIDNHIYDAVDYGWDDEDQPLLKFNVARVPYFLDVFSKRLGNKLKTSKLADIGCGGGLVTEALAKSGLNITGVDMSAPSIETARARIPKLGLAKGQLSYLVGSAYELPFASGSLDGLVSSDVIEHLHDVPQFFSEVFRVLRPGGVFVFDTINRTYFSYLTMILAAQEIVGIVPDDAHAWEMFITPEEVKKGLEAQGFKVAPEGEMKGMQPTVRIPWGKLGKKAAWMGPFTITKSLDANFAWWATKPE